MKTILAKVSVTCFTMSDMITLALLILGQPLWLSCFTSDPAKQRTAIVEPLLKEAAERAQEERAVRRQVAASQKAESDSRMPELRRLIAEHKARNKSLGIANETDTLQCNYAGLPREVPSPLLFDTASSRGYVRGLSAKNTKHNGAIRELQRVIATTVFSSLWNRRTKRVDLSNYWFSRLRRKESSMTYAQNRLKRRLENCRARKVNDAPPSRSFGLPIPGEKTAACLARIARRVIARARRRKSEADAAQMMSALRERRIAA